MLSTDQKGNIAEQAIALAATRLDIGVLRPVGEGGRYDLAFDVGERVLRVQCKWAPRRGDVIVLSSRTNRRGPEGFRTTTYSPAEVDAVAAYCPDTDSCFVVPIQRIDGQSQLHLRLAKPHNGQRGALAWARDFELSTVDWAKFGAVAQLEERLAGSEEAGGSSPPSSTLHAARDEDAAVVGCHEFRNHFGYHLERAAAGESLLITRRGRPYARLSPPASVFADRQLPYGAA